MRKQRKEEQERRDKVNAAKGRKKAQEPDPNAPSPEQELDEHGHPMRVTERPIVLFDKDLAGKKPVQRGKGKRTSVAEGVAEMSEKDEPAIDMNYRMLEEWRYELFQSQKEQSDIEDKISEWAYAFDPEIKRLSAKLFPNGFYFDKFGLESRDCNDILQLLAERKKRALDRGYRHLEKLNAQLYEKWVTALARRIVADEEFSRRRYGWNHGLNDME